MDEILDRYGNLLQEVDRWFVSCLQNHDDLIACRRGCSACCRGLFDITLMDALYLRAGFNRLPDSLRHETQLKAMSRLDVLAINHPEFTAPWLLNTIPESEWDDIMPEDDETHCVLLSEEGTCFVYNHRPMTCRLNGIPLIDTSGEDLSDEWCSLNFIDQDPREILDLRYSFRELFAQELLLFRGLTEKLLGKALNEVDMPIPAALRMDLEMLIMFLRHEKTV